MTIIPFQITAHRGVANDAPENTIPAFQRALDLGADWIELDVRLSADLVPVVFHYYYLHYNTDGSGPVFRYTWEQLRKLSVRCTRNSAAPNGRISTLAEILALFAGKIGLEIEIKGPEPEAPQIIGELLSDYRQHWDRMEVTSYEPALLLRIRELCPDLPADLLIPRTESWMGLDVVAYQALHRARLACARAVHLHPSQLTDETVSSLRSHGLEIHAWDVNDLAALQLTHRLGIPKICTDEFTQALEYRQALLAK